MKSWSDIPNVMTSLISLIELQTFSNLSENDLLEWSLNLIKFLKYN